jgi:hypothetical protein
VSQCVMLLAIVYWWSGLKGPWLSMFGIAMLASAVGLSLGLAAFSLIRTPALAIAALMLSFLAMIALGGRIWQLDPSSPATRVALAMPSRWAFEGLLLLESERRVPPDPTEGSNADDARDLAEEFFPAGSERMGPRADVMALAFMLVGIAAAAAFISTNARPARRSP